MAGAEGTVIACHTKDELDAQLAKADKACKLVVIDFMSPTCGPCQQMAPVFAACAKQYAAKAVFLKVDVDELKEVLKSYCVEVWPTFVFIADGLREETFVGAYPDKLRNTIKELLNRGATAAASASSSAAA